ncbi:hypothetical protein GQ53DRAFT_818837 [Thozetella sp. PMI_491]|nr:hypothetical protein GQ53DRAFT_818837 [Thozetella sp. PMI_491]
MRLPLSRVAVALTLGTAAEALLAQGSLAGRAALVARDASMAGARIQVMTVAPKAARSLDLERRAIPVSSEDVSQASVTDDETAHESEDEGQGPEVALKRRQTTQIVPLSGNEPWTITGDGVAAGGTFIETDEGTAEVSRLSDGGLYVVVGQASGATGRLAGAGPYAIVGH